MPKSLTLFLAALLVVSACGDTDIASSGSITEPEASGAIELEKPTRADIPWSETPEHAQSNVKCPADLEVDTIVAVEEPEVSLVQVAEVPNASALAFAPDGTAFVGTREGLIFRWSEGREPEKVLDLTFVTSTERDQGLLGLAVANDYLFVNRTDAEGESVIEALPLLGGVPSTTGVVRLLWADQPSREHNGGDIVFGPDGHLYLTVGDGGGQGGPFVTGREEPHAFGSLLRFAVSYDPAPSLSAASDNPFSGSIPGSDHAWVWGLRHPYRFSFDSATGDLWIADVGQQCVEEVTMLPGGGDGGEHLGWNAFEGNRPFLGEAVVEHTPPTFSYRHSGGSCAVIGGHVYHGDAMPSLEGKYVFGDFCSRAIIAFDPETGVLQEIEKGTVSPVGFVVGPNGSIYVIDFITGIWRIDPV